MTYCTYRKYYNILYMDLTCTYIHVYRFYKDDNMQIETYYNILYISYMYIYMYTRPIMDENTRTDTVLYTGLMYILHVHIHMYTEQ